MKLASKRIAILVVVVAIIAVGAYALVSSPYFQGEKVPQLKPNKEFKIDIRIYESGSFSLKEIKVNKGDVVALHLTAVDVTHGFKIEGYDVDAGVLVPGKTKTVVFVADKPGHFTFFCTIVCSAQHDLQKGALVVEG